MAGVSVTNDGYVEHSRSVPGNFGSTASEEGPIRYEKRRLGRRPALTKHAGEWSPEAIESGGILSMHQARYLPEGTVVLPASGAHGAGTLVLSAPAISVSTLLLQECLSVSASAVDRER